MGYSLLDANEDSIGSLNIHTLEAMKKVLAKQDAKLYPALTKFIETGSTNQLAPLKKESRSLAKKCKDPGAAEGFAELASAAGKADEILMLVM